MRRWPWIVAAALAVWGGARAAGVFRVEVAGRSMVPVLRPGDWLVVTRRGRVHRGSVVVLTHPDRPLDLVKRVRGIPGDRVEGRPLGTGEYLVVGDNEAASSDGREFGPIPRRAIEGVVRARYWPAPAPVR
jgi:signal peptidase I